MNQLLNILTVRELVTTETNVDIEVIIPYSEAISPKLQHDYQRDEAITKNLSKFLH